MVDLKELPQLTLMIVIVGMVIGAGILVTSSFGSATFYTRNNYNDTVSLTANNTRIALDWGNITQVEQVWNGTNNQLPGACYTVFPVNGSIVFTNETLGCYWNATSGANPTIFLIYDYRDFNTATSAAMTAVTAAIATIASNWLTLIITIVIMSIIIVLIIRSFGFGGHSRR